MAQVSTKKPADGAASADNAAPKRLGLNALDRIGNTPLLRLDHIARGLADVEILGKAEWYNPGGSVKDRAASRIVLEAQRSGKLEPGKILLDSTSGNTGIAYAMIGAAQRIPITLCMPENVSPEPAFYRLTARISFTPIRAKDPTGPFAWRGNCTPSIRIFITTPTNIRTMPTGKRTTMARPTKFGNKPRGGSRILSRCSEPAEHSWARRGG